MVDDLRVVGHGGRRERSRRWSPRRAGRRHRSARRVARPPGRLVARARAVGATRAQIADALDVSAQAAHKRYRDVELDRPGRPCKDPSPAAVTAGMRAASRPLSHRPATLPPGACDRAPVTPDPGRHPLLRAPADLHHVVRAVAAGKGDVLWRSLTVTSGDIVAFVDGDIRNPHPRFVSGLLGPLLLDPQVELVKAFYERPMQVGDVLHRTGGGRVTELLARPLLNLLWPELAGLVQPLSGEYAGRRTLLEASRSSPATASNWACWWTRCARRASRRSLRLTSASEFTATSRSTRSRGWPSPSRRSRFTACKNPRQLRWVCRPHAVMSSSTGTRTASPRTPPESLSPNVRHSDPLPGPQIRKPLVRVPGARSLARDGRTRSGRLPPAGATGGWRELLALIA